MSALVLFGAVWLLLPSTTVGIALLTGLLAAALLALSLGMLARGQLDDDSRRLADRAGLGLGLALLALLGAGLRLVPTAHVADGASTLLYGLATALTALGLSGLVGALVHGAVARVHRLNGSGRRLAGRGVDAGQRRLQRAQVALHALREAVQRLERAHAEAVRRAREEQDASVVRGYRQTAEAIAERLASARVLQGAASRAVVRRSSQLVLHDVLQRRPDAAVAAVGRAMASGPGARRVLAHALRELDRYIDRLQAAQWKVRDEARGAAGSLAAELGEPAGEEVEAIARALDEMLGSYQRAWHQLQALDLQHQAELGARGAVAAAATLSEQGAATEGAEPERALAAQIAGTEAAAAHALSLARDGGDGLDAAVQRAAGLVGGDGGELGEVLRAMRELGEQLAGRGGPR